MSENSLKHEADILGHDTTVFGIAVGIAEQMRLVSPESWVSCFGPGPNSGLDNAIVMATLNVEDVSKYGYLKTVVRVCGDGKVIYKSKLSPNNHLAEYEIEHDYELSDPEFLQAILARYQDETRIITGVS